MGDVIDTRPDRLLRELREHGDWDKACENSGMTTEETRLIAANNSKFDLAIIEAVLQYTEDYILAASEKAITEARRKRTVYLRQIRDQAMEAHRLRHV